MIILILRVELATGEVRYYQIHDGDKNNVDDNKLRFHVGKDKKLMTIPLRRINTYIYGESIEEIEQSVLEGTLLTVR